MSSSASSELGSIPLVVIGWGRENGIVFMPKIFSDQNSPYVMTAMVDFVETFEPYRYSPQNLGAILHNIHPRPRALVIGIAVSPSLVDEITAIWNEYVDIVLKKEFKENDEWKKNACCPVLLSLGALCHGHHQHLYFLCLAASPIMVKPSLCSQVVPTGSSQSVTGRRILHAVINSCISGTQSLKCSRTSAFSFSGSLEYLLHRLWAKPSSLIRQNISTFRLRSWVRIEVMVLWSLYEKKEPLPTRLTRFGYFPSGFGTYASKPQQPE
ncbi:hypothetical protein LCI18_012727 [Fusarium solani-melongenae]|uniref:Uncharacterized protein n=1 Tax=Fusarium solani subsp. cucurbitae TaxID=2747967 RepID=A0ACD3ZKN5_FUSSC|nr:hypothetical protein LCI18_012727 [Fusarium solani-melongenae]